MDLYNIKTAVFNNVIKNNKEYKEKITKEDLNQSLPSVYLSHVNSTPYLHHFFLECLDAVLPTMTR